MTHKILFGSALAIAMAIGANAASACSVDAWSVRNNVGPADAGEPTATGDFPRYSGRCALKVNASNKFVQDNTPNNETSYRARFYYMTGNVTGETDIFQARNTSGTNIIRITHDGNVLRFYVNNGPAPAQVTVADNRYYSIEFAWTAGTVAPPTTGTFTATVTGNSGNNAANSVAGTVNYTGLNNAADSITEARLGVIAGPVPGVNAAGEAAVYFDEFDSRRTTNPGRLCRGDANGSGQITAGDRSAVTAELGSSPTLAAGQPDCNESGSVTSADRSCITQRLSLSDPCATP
jgi:hypothetical protein